MVYPSTHAEFITQHAAYTQDVAERERALQEDPEDYGNQVRLDVAHFKAAYLATRAAKVGIELPVSEESIAVYNDTQSRFGNLIDI